MKPRLLDLFCGAGGAAMGYSRAGFDVTGVDIKPQKHYPFAFIQGDALEYCAEHGKEFDAIHASPPCQADTRMNHGLLQSQGRAKVHPRLIEPMRRSLADAGKPCVIENVVGAALIEPVSLCGSWFGLLVERHRLFECSCAALSVPCCHTWQVRDKPNLSRLRSRKPSRVVGCYGHGRGKGDDVALWSLAMGIDWMTRDELAQAIPPAYTEYIGAYLMAEVLAVHP